MKVAIAVFAFLILAGTDRSNAGTANLIAESSGAITRTLFIDPSSASVALGKVNLTVSSLRHQSGNYVGEYQLRVRPYFFKSESGSLLLAASDDSVRKLQAGTAIAFTGKAVTFKDGKIHTVIGKATPSAGDHGNVRFSIITANGTMVFNTSYHFGS